MQNYISKNFFGVDSSLGFVSVRLPKILQEKIAVSRQKSYSFSTSIKHVDYDKDSNTNLYVLELGNKTHSDVAHNTLIVAAINNKDIAFAFAGNFSYSNQAMSVLEMSVSSLTLDNSDINTDENKYTALKSAFLSPDEKSNNEILFDFYAKKIMLDNQSLDPISYAISKGNQIQQIQLEYIK